MAFVTVAQLKATIGTGSLYSDADLQNICDSADAIIDSYLPHNWKTVVYAEHDTNGTATLWTQDPHLLQVGATINVERVHDHLNGSHVITEVPTSYSLKYTVAHIEDHAKWAVIPSGKIIGEEATDWTEFDAICMAALLIAVDIFQAKTAPSGGAVAVDFQPSPYKMGMSLLSRVKGLLAPYMATGGMIG